MFQITVLWLQLFFKERVEYLAFIIILYDIIFEWWIIASRVFRLCNAKKRRWNGLITNIIPCYSIEPLLSIHGHVDTFSFRISAVLLPDLCFGSGFNNRLINNWAFLEAYWYSTFPINIIWRVAVVVVAENGRWPSISSRDYFTKDSLPYNKQPNWYQSYE